MACPTATVHHYRRDTKRTLRDSISGRSDMASSGNGGLLLLVTAARAGRGAGAFRTAHVAQLAAGGGQQRLELLLR